MFGLLTKKALSPKEAAYVTALLDQQMATDQIRCKSNECLRNIQGESTYRPAIKHLRTYRTSIEHPTNIHRKSIEIYSAHTCAHLCTLVHTCACTHIHTFAYLCTPVHTCACLAHFCTNVHICAHLCMHESARTCTSVQNCAQVCPHVHAHV